MAAIGGCCDERGLEYGDGALYVPNTDEWETFDTGNLEPRQGHTSLLAGNSLVVWGGRRELDQYPEGGRAFGLRGTRVQPRAMVEITQPEGIAPRAGHSAIATRHDLIVWGGCCDDALRPYADGASISIEELTVPAEGTPSQEETSAQAEALDAEDRDAGIGAMIVLGALILLATLAGFARGLRKRSAR
jgi:hypothetical protein